ncbi:MAG TPA: UDP-3-O-acyl-N-acetylglucosamine deacetylase [Candidatus Acidoferrales bacterium]|nr:UDP-3-O-acyl-N-acetylglucosamine deacetylase [Candidatus Acidoferrales bacterium]
MSYQLTIQRPVEIEGIGLHTAVRSHVRLLPAPADTGIVFRRTDLDGFEIGAHADNVARVSYATSLMRQSVLISTTEHLLAALYCCGIENVFVELDALELPILDGSARPFIDILTQAGTRRLRRRRRYIRVLRPLEFADGDRRIGIYPADEFRVRCFVDYRHPAAGPQEVEMIVNAESFGRELAPARTFTFVKELLALQKMGLIRGGSLANAIVMDDQCILNGPLRFPDEFVRHKALDLIGDLALVGRPLLARIVAHKAGHALHTQLVTRLLSDRSLWEETTMDRPVTVSEEKAPAVLSVHSPVEAD